MLERFCFGLLILNVLTNEYRVSAEHESSGGSRIIRSAFSDDYTPHVPVENEIGRAAYLPLDEKVVLRREVKLHCMGDDVIKHLIFWTKNGVRQEDNVDTEENADMSLFQSVLTVTSFEEARYSCNGIYLYVIKTPDEKETPISQISSVWQNNDVICINKIRGKDIPSLQIKIDGYKTQVEYQISDFKYAFYPIESIAITEDKMVQCNGTENWEFIAETRPETTVEFKSKTVICRNTDTQGRCLLKIYFGDKIVAEGLSPTLEHNYGKINIQHVRCTADCEIGEDFISLPVTEIEINRALYICIILVIILIILLIIILILCVLWHKFGFKDKYGYEINMRLKKNFAVDTNKLSSYRLSGVQAADVPVEADGSDPDVRVKDPGDGSLVDDDSFVDPNFARGNNKLDMRSKDDISSSGGASNPRPFLRI